MKATLLIVCGLCLNVFGGELPADAAALKAKRDAKVAEIDSAYLGALSKLRDGYLAKGELSKAEAISEVISGEPKPKDEGLSGIVGTWRRDTDGGVWEFKSSKDGVFNGKMPFNMTFDAVRGKILVVGKHWVDQLTITSNSDVIYGVADSNGRKTRYRLDRVK